MDILSFSAGFVLGRKGAGASGTHPDAVIYTDNDTAYEAPDTAQGETFDTYTEAWTEDNERRVWGVGVFNKGAENEKVTRLIYPDKTYVVLVNF